MESHLQLSDSDFENQFADHTIDPAIFTHEAHLRLAWIHIHQYGLDTAITNICSQLKSFTQVLGVPDKYNETVTVAAIRAVYHFTLQSKAGTFEAFIEEHPRLKTNFKQMLAQHYTIDIFTDPKVKALFVQPDKLPFD
jgi:hypothetical protein